MLIRFSVENFLSIKERQTLDMSAVSSCKERNEENTFDLGGEKLLKTLVVYGANASGKTNLFLSMNFFRSFVVNSSKESQSEEKIPIIPFLLNSQMKSRPSCFEIEFILDKKQFRYGFVVTRDEVIKEWLFNDGKALFLRGIDHGTDIIQIEKGWQQASGLEARTRRNALFLSVCAQFAMPEAENLMSWFNQKFHQISADRQSGFIGYTIHRIQDGKYRNEIIAFLKNADTNITDITIKETSLPSSSPAVNITDKKKTTYDIKTTHNVYDDNGNVVSTITFPLEGLESLGTQKAFALAGPIIDTLKTGAILVVDELDSRLHPIFTRQIVKMFNSPENNPLNAQLIFNTHDTNLLSYHVYNCKTKKEEYLFRRDQIFFAEKDSTEATHLYSLIEFKKKSDGKKIRNDASFEKDYLNGFYGAIPFIGDLMNASENANE